MPTSPRHPRLQPATRGCRERHGLSVPILSSNDAGLRPFSGKAKASVDGLHKRRPLEPHLGKGTASAVPIATTKNGALAPEACSSHRTWSPAPAKLARASDKTFPLPLRSERHHRRQQNNGYNLERRKSPRRNPQHGQCQRQKNSAPSPENFRDIAKRQRFQHTAPMLSHRMPLIESRKGSLEGRRAGIHGLKFWSRLVARSPKSPAIKSRSHSKGQTRCPQPNPVSP